MKSPEQDMNTGRNLKITSRSFFFQKQDNGKTMLVFLGISVFLHLSFFIGLMFAHDFKLPKKMPPVIQIDLVSFAPEPVLNEPEPGPAKVEEATSEEGPAPIEKVQEKPKQIKHKKPDISLKQKPKNLKELMAKAKKKEKTKPKPKEEKKKPAKKENKKTQEELDRAREKLAKEVEQKKEQQLAEAMARLKKEIGQKKQDNKTGEGAGQGTTGKRGGRPIDLYHIVIGSRIEQNWVFNDTLAKMDKNLEVRVIVKILKSGEIRDIIFETRSGNRYLDESVKRAIKKSNPFPELPGNRRSYDFGLIFTPRGLK